MKSSENSLKTPKGCLSCSIRLENYFSPTGNKKLLLFETIYRFFFFPKMTHSAENPKDSSMLAMCFVSSKRRGSFDKSKSEQSGIEKRRS